MAWTEAQVPLLDPATDKFPDRFAPPSVASDKAAAEAAKLAAEHAQADAEAAQSAAETAQGAATTQAGIATTQAGIATTQAGIATTQAGIATTQAGTATTQAGLAQTAAGAASLSAGAADDSADVSAAQAAIATTQAGIATTQAETATTQAGIATTKAGEASTSASTATTKAGEASASAAAALVSEQNAAATLAGAVTKAGTAGLVARDGSGAVSSRTITGGGIVSVANGSGAAGDPTLSTPMYLTGTASPMGVVTPSTKGVVYVDTAQTLGARVWVSTGTTNTAWTVIDGDTGWRNLSTYSTSNVLTSGTAYGAGWVPRPGAYVSSASIRRVNGVVEVRLINIQSDSATATSRIIVAPAGFAAETEYGSVSHACQYVVSGSSTLLWMDSDLSPTALQTITSGGFLYLTLIRYRTSEAWPTS